MESLSRLSINDHHSTEDLPYEIQAVTLLQLLSNPLILHHTVPYLPISSTLALGATSKSFTDLVHHTPYVFRHLDLRNVKRAQAVNTGHFSINRPDFRVQRYDEEVTDEDFYSRPLSGIFDNLRRQHILKDVQTLILDGLSVPAQILSEIILNDSYNVRLLSIREVHNLNERKLIQVLRYAVRPTRPENTPKLKGLYIFGPKDPKSPKPLGVDDVGIKMTISSEWNQKSCDHLSQSLYGTSEKWYRKSGKMIEKAPLSEWGSVLLECKDIISFDAPLCAGPRHSHPTQAKSTKPESGPWYGKEEFHIPPMVATFAVGGCHSCGKSPEGLAKFGQYPTERFPLLSPVPLHHSTIKAAKIPETSPSSSQPHIVARCLDCLRNRYCENCHKWWCEDCYDVSSNGHNLHPLSMVSPQQPWDVVTGEEKSNDVKGVSRECWDCGLNCLDCSLLTQKHCNICKGGYCTIHNEGSTLTTCDWCSTGRNRHRELY